MLSATDSTRPILLDPLFGAVAWPAPQRFQIALAVPFSAHLRQGLGGRTEPGPPWRGETVDLRVEHPPHAQKRRTAVTATTECPASVQAPTTCAVVAEHCTERKIGNWKEQNEKEKEEIHGKEMIKNEKITRVRRSEE